MLKIFKCASECYVKSAKLFIQSLLLSYYKSNEMGENGYNKK
jgi:hypothetical protein